MGADLQQKFKEMLDYFESDSNKWEICVEKGETKIDK